MFEPVLLRSFVAVAESGGFTNAAGLLNSTQSTVRSVQLTSAGETLLGYARTIMRLNEDARLRLSGVRHAGRVRVGAQEDLTDSWLPQVLQRFCRQFPEVELEVEIGIGTRLFEMVQTQELELAVGAVPSVLPLAFFPQPCPYREAALRALAASQKQWRIVSTSSSLAGVRASVVAGLALTPLPMHTIEPGLRILGKEDKMPRLPEIEFVLQTRETDTWPLVAALGNLIQEMVAKSLYSGGMDEMASPTK